MASNFLHSVCIRVHSTRLTPECAEYLPNRTRRLLFELFHLYLYSKIFD